MGGNARAIDRKTLQTKRWNNRDAFAQRFEFNEVSSSEFLLLIVQLLETINVKFFTKTHKQLWKKITDNIFLGSSSHLWNSNVKLESLGDIDIAIPGEFLPALFDVLSTFEETELFTGVVYIGQNNEFVRTTQINAVFFCFDRFFQIDFVATPFIKDSVSPFTKFARSSPIEDVHYKIKGVAHKYLLSCLAWSVSHRDDLLLLTDKSSLQFSKLKFKTLHEPIRVCSFSVEHGLRNRLEFCKNFSGTPEKYNHKFLCKEIPVEKSTYETDLDVIFQRFFSKIPSESERTDFCSFVGLSRLAKKLLTKERFEFAIYQMFAYKLYGKGQSFSRSQELDKKVKQPIIDFLFSEFPELKKFEQEVHKMQKKYYEGYNEHLSQ